MLHSSEIFYHGSDRYLSFYDGYFWSIVVGLIFLSEVWWPEEFIDYVNATNDSKAVRNFTALGTDSDTLEAVRAIDSIFLKSQRRLLSVVEEHI